MGQARQFPAARRVVFAGLGLGLLLAAAPAWATDTWTTPFTGIQQLHRTGANKLNLYAAVIDLCAAGISVRHTAFEERAKKTSVFATSVGGQLAVNADFSCRPIDVDPAKSPFKPCVNKPAYVTYGIAAHAGVPWPQTLSKDALLGFGPERAQIYDNDEDKAFDPGWMQEVLSGHWSTVLNGKITGADCPIDPRTSVGLSADGNKLIVVVVDGRNGWRGMTCIEVAQVLIELGADRGFNLDGGGSSTFWQQGAGVLNHPSDGTERVVGPHLVIMAPGSGPSPHCEKPSVFDPTAPLPAFVALGKPAWLQTIVPQRVFDTRTPAQAAPLQGLKTDAQGRMLAGTTASWGDATLLPADAVAALMNLTVVNAEAPGFLTAWSGVLPVPQVSWLNHGVALAVGNSGAAALGSQHTFAVHAHSTTDVIGDLQGYFASTGAGFTPITPYRALDTRDTLTPLQPGVPRVLLAPQAGVSAAALTLAAVLPAGPGFISVYPCGQAVPLASNLNFQLGEDRAGTVLAGLGTQGVCAVSSVKTDLIVDVFGTFAVGQGSAWQAVTPVRLIDTRNASGRWTGKVRPEKDLELRFADMPGFPAGAVGVSFNVVAVAPRGTGFLAFGACGSKAATSNLDFRENQVIANAAWMGLDTKGSLCLHTSVRTHVVIDLTGVFLAPPPPPSSGPETIDAGSSLADLATTPDAGSSPIDMDTPDAAMEVWQPSDVVAPDAWQPYDSVVLDAWTADDVQDAEDDVWTSDLVDVAAPDLPASVTDQADADANPDTPEAPEAHDDPPHDAGSLADAEPLNDLSALDASAETQAVPVAATDGVRAASSCTVSPTAPAAGWWSAWLLAAVVWLWRRRAGSRPA